MAQAAAALAPNPVVGGGTGGNVQAMSTAPDGDVMIRCDVSRVGPCLNVAVGGPLGTSAKARGLGVVLSVLKVIVEAYFGRTAQRPSPPVVAAFAAASPPAAEGGR